MTAAAAVRRIVQLSAAARPARAGRPGRWGFAVDSLVAVGLALAAVLAALDRTYVEVAHPQDAPHPPPVPEPGVFDALPDPDPALLPEPVPAVEVTLPPVGFAELALAALTALPLLGRRRYPLSTLGAVLAATVLLHGGPVVDGTATAAFAAALVAAYSAAVHGRRRAVTAAALLLAAVLYAAAGLAPALDDGVLSVLLVGLGALTVHGVQGGRRLAREKRERQREELRLAVARERSRIARELHDVVTHNVSMMTIQAGAARKVLDTSPGQAREAMLAVESAGRSAMSELRHVMGLLTMSGDGGAADGTATGDGLAGLDGLAPQPGLDRLPELVARVRGTGVEVALEMRGSGGGIGSGADSGTGSGAGLPSGVGLAAYRVVQESLTNAVKHAAGARITVAVEQVDRELRVEVADTGGRPSAPAGPGGGHGLIGLRERLAVYGGTLEAGPADGGGYRVRAVIPAEAG